LLRGSLFLAFSGSTQVKTGCLRIWLRPMIGYCPSDELCYVAPTNEWPDAEQLFIDVRSA